MDGYAYAPVMAGLWSHESFVRNVFDIDDLLDAHEMLAVRHENEWRAQEAAEKNQK